MKEREGNAKESCAEDEINHKEETDEYVHGLGPTVATGGLVGAAQQPVGYTGPYRTKVNVLHDNISHFAAHKLYYP